MQTFEAAQNCMQFKKKRQIVMNILMNVPLQNFIVSIYIFYIMHCICYQNASTYSAWELWFFSGHVFHGLIVVE